MFGFSYRTIYRLSLKKCYVKLTMLYRDLVLHVIIIIIIIIYYELKINVISNIKQVIILKL